MPYINGKKVTVHEWVRVKNEGLQTPTFSPKEPAEEPEPELTRTDEAPKPRRRRGTKKQQAEAALAAVTGLDIDLGDEEENQ